MRPKRSIAASTAARDTARRRGRRRRPSGTPRRRLALGPQRVELGRPCPSVARVARAARRRRARRCRSRRSASARLAARPWPWAAPVIRATGRLTSPRAVWLQVAVEVDLQRVVEDVRREHDRPERGEQTICSSLKRSASRAYSSSSTPCGSSASRRPNSAISSSSSSSSSESGSSPASISSRRKNVEQMRQSACGRDRVAEEPRPPLAQERRDRVVQRIPLQQRVERDRRVRERPLHVRHAPAGGGVRGGQLPRGRGGGALVKRANARHVRIMAAELADRPSG